MVDNILRPVWFILERTIDMQCQLCNEQSATIHLTEISNGKRIESHLCQSCAQKQGLAVNSQVPLNELLGTLLAAESEAGVILPNSEGLDLSCPSCGTTLEEFSKNTLLGCPNDYEVFGEHINPLISKTQGGNLNHCGKVPSKAPADAQNQIELINLQRQLETAVKDEDYETAAKLRDRIQQLT